jgi:prolyl-tRNA synthetase
MSKKTAIVPTRSENFPEWYQQVVKASELAETSVSRGCMVIRPWGYAVWENIQRVLDDKFKETGHVNAYFPLLIPVSFLEKEAEHVDGFAKECAVVTHHRLEDDGNGGLKPAGKLEEPYVIRPTSETIIGDSYARWVQSYRDLPILVNQWANVFRWEMRTRLFLRTSEFLWQEGHTVHATSEEAQEETMKMLKVYEEFAKEYLAIPVIPGMKTPDEKFPGAVDTFTIEAMMQDRKAVQAGTSHFLGQNFAKASGIKFQNENSEEVFAWTTSWGVSTRLIGALIMAHSDDDGFVVPPKVAPQHVVIQPIYKNAEQRPEVLEYCKSIQTALRSQVYGDQKIRCFIDDRDIRGGEKTWQNIKKGVPIRLEIGPRDIKNGKVFMGRRDLSPKDKTTLSKEEFIEKAQSILEEIQTNLYTKAKSFRDENTVEISTLDEFEKFFSSKNDNEISGGFALVNWCEDAIDHELLAKLKVTPRCIPLSSEAPGGNCVFTGKAATHKVIFAKAY